MSIVTETIAKVQAEIASLYNETIGEFALDGNIKRFEKCNSWLVGNSWDFKGKEYCTIMFGNWKFADGTHRVDSFEKKEFKDKTFLKDFTRKMEAVNERLEKEKSEKWEKCRKKWLPIWKSARKDELHDYLIDKGIEKPFTSRIDAKGVMLIPAYDEFRFVGVQRVYHNPSNDEFEKRFAGGIKIKGSICPLSPFKNAPLVYVSEGYSTACTVQTAFPKAPSICVFNAGNIYQAVLTIRKINPSCKIIICADRDKESNTGEKFSRITCSRVSSCIYRMPEFKNDNGRWSDFNDLHQFGSLKMVQDQLKFNPSDFISIQPLGVIDDRYFYMSSENPQPIKLSGHNHTERYLYNLVPDQNWWKNQFPKFDKDDENKEFPIGVNWTWAGTALMKRSLEKGRFDFSNVRSSGVWEDNGRFYYHNGFELYDGQKNVDIFSDLLSKNYVMGKSCYSIEKHNQLTEKDRGNLLEIFGTINTKNRQQGFLLLGWLVCAPIAGGLPWRPHIWLTGESSQGKSWTMENIMGVVLNGFCLRPQGDSSEAGIRQSVGNQSLPLVFDEFEVDDIRTSQRVGSIVALARQASTQTEGDIMRGTTGGSAMTFSPNFAMCVSGINPSLTHKQDKNRWTVIEFTGERSSEEQFQKIQEIVKETFTSDFSRKMVSYAFHNNHIFIENFNTIEIYLRKKGYKGHFCRQYASLLAGFMMIVHPEAIDTESLNDYLDDFDFGEFFEQSGEDDPDVFKESLLSSFIRLDSGSMTIAELINMATNNRGCPFQKVLMRYGIKSGVGCFYIKRTSNKNFEELFSTSKWKNNWGISLLRIKDATKNDNKSVWINGASVKVIRIPFDKWETKGE